MPNTNDQGAPKGSPTIVDLLFTDPERLIEAVQEQMFGDSNTGFCIACGEERDGCEPDARNYPCESCGEHKVYGASELLMMGYIPEL